MMVRAGASPLRPILAAILVLSAFLPGVFPGEARPEPRFRRDEARPATARRAPQSRLPVDLVPSAPVENRRAAATRNLPPESAESDTRESAPTATGAGEPPAPGAKRTRPNIPPVPVPRPGPTYARIEAAGLEAGAWTAEEFARTQGWLEVYRAGVYDGQRSALSDPDLGRWDYEQGIRLGRSDPEGREAGSREGARAAEDLAVRDAAAQVEQQFMDLGWRPVPSPLLPEPSFTPDFGPTPAPEIEPLFREFPLARVALVPRRMLDGFTGWSWDPWRLYGASSRAEFLDASWQDADRAFGFWSSDRRRSAFWRALDTPGRRALFEASFADGFLDRLSVAFVRLLDPAYRDGFEDGWIYGGFLRSEWSFRQGYAAGFDGGMDFAAEVAFDRSYPAAYARAYDAEFRRWMGTARPAILDARLRDANDDEVFQPGEGVEVDYTLANHGGTAGAFSLRLEGGSLESTVEASVQIPARSRVPSAKPLRATVNRATAVPSRSTLVLLIDGERLDLPLRVSYPIEFTTRVSFGAHPLEGRADVGFEVVNRSRKPVERIEVTREPTGGDDAGERRMLGPLEPGSSETVSFAVERVASLELLAGALVVRASASVGGEVHARTHVRSPALATDLGNPALVSYLVHLGREAEPSPSEVSAARRLLMQRLEADWQARSGDEGNPYKEDERGGGVRTALGELVRAYERDRPALRASLAFNGLSDEIVALADRLPGSHPLLRRWFVRLASSLP